MSTVQVNASSGSYPIFIQGGDSVFASIADYIHGKQVLIVSNSTVAPLYLQQLSRHIEAAQLVCNSVILPDGEQYKSIDSITQIWDALMQHRYSRNCTIIALGGGVVGDMAGFAAASYQRGVDFIQVPTTLLSQVDSSVGGKTGVNHALGKNMIGAFKQPKAVFIDTSMLDTLSDRELSAGIAEVIKYALIRDINFLTWLETNMPALLARDKQILAHAIQVCCQHKAEVVAADEFETGERALLNLGHTFGHAIETHMGYGAYLHGEAVAIGMHLAAIMSAHMGWLTTAEVERIKTLLLAANLPVDKPAAMSEADFLAVMAHDKKNLSGLIRLILMPKLGQAIITQDYSLDALQRTLAGT